MKIALTLVLAILLVAPALAQREAVVRGIGTETCKKLIASEHTVASVNTDDHFAQQALQWILGSSAASDGRRYLQEAPGKNN